MTHTQAMRQRILDAISAWAQSYYPARANPPPRELQAIQFTTQELTDLFNQTGSIQAHLALVDQAASRDSPDLRQAGPAVRGSWLRHGGTVL